MRCRCCDKELTNSIKGIPHGFCSLRCHHKYDDGNMKTKPVSQTKKNGIIKMEASGRSLKYIAEFYGVSYSYVSILIKNIKAVK